jgi:hypothetical protein
LFIGDFAQLLASRDVADRRRRQVGEVREPAFGIGLPGALVLERDHDHAP